ncbi:hypothetical protein ColTof3_04499 [Colletotrichum tofieldiae]|nr:hypothetical protein ColTof3_04499 [Colletotrichum tofieldiae]GKT86896.1 hypothetical protein Ct61P_04746 [Colletotrichum tofieldiae]
MQLRLSATKFLCTSHRDPEPGTAKRGGRQPLGLTLRHLSSQDSEMELDPVISTPVHTAAGGMGHVRPLS